MSAKQWIFDPDSGGVRIKENIKRRTEERIIRYAESNLAGRYTDTDLGSSLRLTFDIF